jgi:hypothetical protein
MNVLPGENIITISDENLGSFIVGTLRVIPQIMGLNIGAMIGMEFFFKNSPIFAYFRCWKTKGRTSSLDK